jgi:hypothetical protein
MWRQRWWRRSRRRRRRRRRTTLIKSNNPHLAGGEKYINMPNQGNTPCLPYNHPTWAKLGPSSPAGPSILRLDIDGRLEVSLTKVTPGISLGGEEARPVGNFTNEEKKHMAWFKPWKIMKKS